MGAGAGMETRRLILERLIKPIRPRVVRSFAPPPAPIARDIWSLERRLLMPGGLGLPTRTTVIRLRSQGLLVVSPPPVEAGGMEHLDSLGQVAEALLPNSFHYLNAREFLARHPRALLRIAPELRLRAPELPSAEELTDEAPESWRGSLEHLILGPVHGLSEIALFHHPSATLILTDLAFHMIRFERRLDRLAWRLAGVPAGFGPSRTSRRLLLCDRRVAAAFLERVLAWPFERVLVAHGEPLELNAGRVFRRAFAAYVSA